MSKLNTILLQPRNKKMLETIQATLQKKRKDYISPADVINAMFEYIGNTDSGWNLVCHILEKDFGKIYNSEKVGGTND
jgi:hypothetical protein